MKILTLLGSPRPRGNTATILGWFEEQAAAAGHSLQRIHLTGQHLEGCLGCYACQGDTNEPDCIQEDAISEMLRAILAADLVVYASPVYCWGFTAQMKALVDRHFCLVKWRDGVGHRTMPGKPAMLLTTCGDHVEDNADLIQVMFERQIQYLHWRVLGQYAVGGCSTPDALGELARAAARAMFEALCQETARAG